MDVYEGTYTQDELIELCTGYLRSQVSPVKNLWQISPAVERVVGYVDACKALHGLREHVEAQLRADIGQTALGVREKLIFLCYPPRSSRQQEPINEPAVNWWAGLSESKRQEWLEYLKTDAPIDAWDEHERISQEYDGKRPANTPSESQH